jgi:hypothetical protein
VRSRDWFVVLRLLDTRVVRGLTMVRARQPAGPVSSTGEGNDRNAVERQKNDVRHATTYCFHMSSLVVDHLVERLNEKPRWHHPGILGSQRHRIAPKPLLNFVRAADDRGQLRLPTRRWVMSSRSCTYCRNDFSASAIDQARQCRRGCRAEPGTNSNAARSHSAEKSAFPRKKHA